MKGKNKSLKWIITILMLLVTVVILAGALLPYLRIDISKVIELFPSAVEDIFDEITEILGSAKGKITFSALTLVRASSKVNTRTVAGDIMRSLQIMILLPYIAVFIAAIFSLVRRSWSYIVSGVFAALGLTVAVLSVVKFVPSAIYRAFPQYLLNLFHALPIQFDEAYLRNYVFKGIGIAWWFVVAGCVLLLGLSIAGVVIAVQGKRSLQEEAQESIAGDSWQMEREPVKEDAVGDIAPEKEKTVPYESAVPASRGISCGFGDLNGVEIPMREGETITIGSDSSRCNIVAADVGIESIHCRITYNEKIGCYEVTDLSKNGIFIDGRRIAAGTVIRAVSGTILFLAGTHAVGLL